jgi:hypothetical protein
MRVMALVGRLVVAVGLLVCGYAAFVAWVSLDPFAAPSTPRPATPPGTALSFLPLLLIGVALVVVGRELCFWLGGD